MSDNNQQFKKRILRLIFPHKTNEELPYITSISDSTWDTVIKDYMYRLYCIVINPRIKLRVLAKYNPNLSKVNIVNDHYKFVSFDEWIKKNQYDINQIIQDIKKLKAYIPESTQKKNDSLTNKLNEKLGWDNVDNNNVITIKSIKFKTKPYRILQLNDCSQLDTHYQQELTERCPYLVVVLLRYLKDYSIKNPYQLQVLNNDEYVTLNEQEIDNVVFQVLKSNRDQLDSSKPSYNCHYINERFYEEYHKQLENKRNEKYCEQLEKETNETHYEQQDNTINERSFIQLNQVVNKAKKAYFENRKQQHTNNSSTQDEKAKQYAENKRSYQAIKQSDAYHENDYPYGIQQFIVDIYARTGSNWNSSSLRVRMLNHLYDQLDDYNQESIKLKQSNSTIKSRLLNQYNKLFCRLNKMSPKTQNDQKKSNYSQAKDIIKGYFNYQYNGQRNAHFEQYINFFVDIIYHRLLNNGKKTGYCNLNKNITEQYNAIDKRVMKASKLFQCLDSALQNQQQQNKDTNQVFDNIKNKLNDAQYQYEDNYEDDLVKEINKTTSCLSFFGKQSQTAKELRSELNHISSNTTS